MVDLFLDRVLVENNWDQDELNTEREIVGILENRVVLLFFASAECDRCRQFVPVLNEFFKKLKDPAHIEYPKLLVLILIRCAAFSIYCFIYLFIYFITVSCALSPAWTNPKSSRSESSKRCTRRFCSWPLTTRTGSRWRC